MGEFDEQVARAARTVGHTLPTLQAEALAFYVELVFKWNRIANLTGARSRAEFITHHLADCLTIVPYIAGQRVLDLGSGAGLPGIVLACVAPTLDITLVEPRGKRVRFLEQVRIELGLSNVRVVPLRIQDWCPQAPIDTFVCRAFGSLSEFVAATRPVQTIGCRLLAMKGHAPSDEIAALEGEPYRIDVRSLVVPGWEARHLVICERIAG